MKNQSDTKHCSNCKTETLKTDFYKNKSLKDGLSAWCKTCTKVNVEIYKKKLSKPITGKYQWHRSNK